MSLLTILNQVSIFGEQDELDDARCAEAPPCSSSPDLLSNCSPFLISVSRRSSPNSSKPPSPSSNNDSRVGAYESQIEFNPASAFPSNDTFMEQLDVLLLDVVKKQALYEVYQELPNRQSKLFPKPLLLGTIITRRASLNMENFSDSGDYPLEDLSPLATLSNFTNFYPAENNTTVPIDAVLPLHASVPSFSNYRIIKRAESYQPELAHQELKPPSHKRLRNDSNLSAQHHNRAFAAEPASLRRAASLRSDVDPEELTPASGVFCVPTAPSTPVPSSRVVNVTSCRLSQPVPVIAPPVDHTALLPQSTELLAKARISAFIYREKALRLRDRLFPETLILSPTTQDNFLGSVACSSDRKKSFDDNFSNTSDESDEDNEDEASIDSQLDDRYHDEGKDPDSLRYSDTWEAILNIGQHEREQVVRWLLEVVPVYTCLDSVPSSSNSSFSSTVFPEQEPDVPNLIDQLTTCPDTRFHAAWMFLRYFYLVMSESDNHNSRNERRKLKPGSQPALPNEIKAGSSLVVWDVALGCLALSIKLHRDFLFPLLPVFAYEYISLSPHEMSYDDLETAQRDILSAFDYSLGGSPQLVLSEIWLALPALRTLLDFDGGWNYTQKQAWWKLFDALSEPDVLRFSVALLSVSALLDAILDTLVRHYEFQETWTGHISKYNRGRIMDSGNALRQRAEKNSKVVFEEIQAVVGVTDVQLNGCRRWFNF